ncbi:hypothetical protein AMS68_003548 [Peltaster fructicola]|uniref:NodB homology domain-containing protein n=1 Tax=Peltaster fructicola TaxID=286661 RepID=A0A6H0XTN5_9PEZI|nr:hypothetical protein AMS68_003548 [Peltaster fructicola]
MWQPLVTLLGGSLAAAHTLMNYDDLWQPSGLTERGATQCGPSYNNQVCDAGQCCSADGLCGTANGACVAPACQFQWGPGCDANQTPPGTNTSTISRPKFGNVPYGTTITHCNTPGKVALTFDDGPYLYTSDLLDLLKSQNVKATFFIVGNNGGKGQIELDSTPWPAIMRRAFNEGHQIASHTWSHQSLDALTPQQITDQIIKNEIAFSDVFGFIPTYLRPPYGFCSSSACQTILGNLGYHIVTWNLDTLDWQENYANSRNIFSSAIQSSDPSKDSFLPLTHDIHNGTVHGFVQYMLDTLRAKGYSTILLGDCLNDPKENWYRDAKSGNQWTGSAAATTASSTQQPTTSSTSSTSSTSTTSSTSPISSTSSTVTQTTSTASTSTTSVSTSSAKGSANTSPSKTAGSSSSSTATQACSGLAGCVVAGLGSTPAPGVNGKNSSSLSTTTTTTSSTSAAAATAGLSYVWYAVDLALSILLLGLINV